MTRLEVHAVAIALVLAIVAAIAPTPPSSDRGIYEQVGRQVLIRDCADGHCFRPLVAGVLEHLPGPSLVKWKSYAVIANAIAALAIGRFCLLLGLSTSSAIAATWLDGLGTGALYSLYDSYTSDPLMYVFGPVMAIALWQGRERRAGVMAAVGVFAKEFAAAPMWIFGLFAVLERRRSAAVRLLLTAAGVTLLWLGMQAGLMALQNYRYGATASADLLHGGFVATWLRSVGPSGALLYLFTTYGALYLLLPPGFARGGRDLRLLALSALPAAIAFVYVEQPERALWNFHFVVIPIAAVVLQALPPSLLALFATASAAVSLRYGAQLPIRTVARAALVVSLALAALAVIRALRSGVRRGWEDRRAEALRRDDAKSRHVRGLWWGVAAELLALILLSAVLIDVRAHRQDEAAFGVNQWGYRGPLATAVHPGIRVAVVGGSAAFAATTPWDETMAAQLASAINARRRWNIPGGPFASVDNLSEPAADAGSYVATLRDYAYLDPDVVCVYDGYGAADRSGASRGRRASVAFRFVGYLPMNAEARDENPPDWLRNDDVAGEDVSCAGRSAAYCASMADTVRYALQRGDSVVVATPPYLSNRHRIQQRSLADVLARQFGGDPRFLYVDLGSTVDLTDRSQSRDGVHPTASASRAIAVSLADAVDRVRNATDGATESHSSS